jgi:hypothetical protein
MEEEENIRSKKGKPALELSETKRSRSFKGRFIGE